jgi:cellulose synthase/poly-beta-1,6-N-acetylglucosamine synthase-like glycosyltransferase
MQPWQLACLVIYCGIVIVLAIYGYHRFLMLRLFNKYHKTPQQPKDHFAQWPLVTVQLPIYNEFHVVERLLETVVKLDYPGERLQIQVLDDSQDETCKIARAAVARLAKQGFNITYHKRNSREGFKAGALEAGLATASGEYILILDADFLPPPSILHQAIHYFTDSEIGMVQMRWGHLNRDYSLLTHIQSIFLDGHFVIEHTARSRSGRFFNFNGTAGIWRKEAIASAGGWQHDTLTEDLDLSYRAQLAGWKFVYLPEVEVPAEIPVEMNAFKSQQHRWTKGAVQVAKKILPRVWRSSYPLKIKIEATFHLTANTCYILMLLMAILTLPVLHIRTFLGWERMLIVDLPLFSMATMAISGYYIASQRALYPNWKEQIKYLPILMAIGMGLCINNTRAVIEGWIGHQSAFLRTPKYGVIGQGDGGEQQLDSKKKRKYSGRKTLLALGELFMAAYFVVVIYKAWITGLYFGIPFLMLFHVGFLYIGLTSVLQSWSAYLRMREPLPRLAS